MHHVTGVPDRAYGLRGCKSLGLLSLLVLALLHAACDSAGDDMPGLNTNDVEVLIDPAMDAQGPFLDVSVTNHTGRTLGFVSVTFTFFRDDVQVKSSVFPVPSEVRDDETVQGSVPLWTRFDSHEDYTCYRYKLFVSDLDDNNAEATYPGTCSE